jgi:hypothetical protein
VLSTHQVALYSREKAAMVVSYLPPPPYSNQIQ